MSIPALVSSSFCVPHSTEFEVKKKSVCSPNKYTITDGEGNLVFKVKAEGGFFSHMRRIIYDAASEEVLLVLKREVPWCGELSWVAFRGDSESESQVLFTVRKKRPAWCSSRVLFEVFLPENHDSENPDFSIEAKSRRSKYSVLFNGTPIAKGTKTGWGMVYSVQVDPEVDRAFIAALSIIWIQERLKKHRGQQGAIGGAM